MTFACRTCDDCIATRRHNWIARAMAEKTQWPHTLCVALTYSDETQHNRDAAQMFCYADVRAFMARLRSAAKRYAKKKRLNVEPVIRFLCAGEQGDRNGRCHWHLILYSNVPLWDLGEVRIRRTLLQKLADMLTIGKRKRRLNWSLWEHGYCTFQEPDEGGMAYVLSYCLKDQFTGEKSEGTMREAKSENFATGLFRMSKRPAIGEQWLFQKMERLLAARAVMPKLEFRVPGMSGYWVPNGTFRKKALWALVALNKRIVWTTGAPAPQWSSLIASLEGSEADLEVLLGKPEEENPDIAAQLARRSREEAQRHQDAEFVRSCGRELPCWKCLNGYPDETLARLGLERYEDEAYEIRYRALPGFEDPAKRRSRPGAGLHTYCHLRGTAQARRVFPATGG
ncbi:rolling circle replication-associated protein [Oceanicola sp. S124]|uniref:rolling circle replication-associated protein n=1 Tax=Oceanicola sp. S124 TaxID=1042378 RepID=UPI00110FACC5|nr:hypothetical protein [Oceanicola sp. S124]